MDIAEQPLLNYPSLSLSILRAAAAREVTQAECLTYLERLLRRAHEPSPAPQEEIMARLEIIAADLLAAELLEGDSSRFHITRQGRLMLRQHPMGLDENAVAQLRPPPPPKVAGRPVAAAALTEEYDEGFAAGRSGHALSDNPYAHDSARHLAWENGWSEACDAYAKHQLS